MKHKQNNIYVKGSEQGFFINRINILKQLTLFFIIITMTACSDFVEIEPPKNLLISETVFDDPATVESALANLFYNMREQGMVSGKFGTTTLMGIYSDELDYYGFDADFSELFHHNVTASNNAISGWWSNA